MDVCSTENCSSSSLTSFKSSIQEELVASNIYMETNILIFHTVIANFFYKVD